ncbi:hypothetical protein SRHO_G00007640 [Serrasalmus rhombeus]
MGPPSGHFPKSTLSYKDNPPPCMNKYTTPSFFHFTLKLYDVQAGQFTSFNCFHIMDRDKRSWLGLLII